MKKILAIGVILLFIGVAVAPSINQSVVKASNDNDLVEVTTQACGIQGYGNTTVKLTREQYNNLEQYLVEFRARLNQTSTKEEAVPIFKEAVVELDKYGLLPSGMSVERVQKLVTLMCSNQKARDILKRFVGGSQVSGNGNMFCLVAGKANLVNSLGVFYPLRVILLNILDLILLLIGFVPIGMLLLLISDALLELRSFIFPWYLFSEFGIGYLYKEWDMTWWREHPSTGTIVSLGLFGLKTYSGSFYGQIRSIHQDHIITGFAIQASGILGFTGLKIRMLGNNFLIGSCLLIDLGSSPPEQ
jgi:hypothetical protein